MMDETIVLNM